MCCSEKRVHVSPLVTRLQGRLLLGALRSTRNTREWLQRACKHSEESAGGTFVGDCPACLWSLGFSPCAWSLPRYSSSGQTACGSAVCQSRAWVQGTGHESQPASPMSHTKQGHIQIDKIRMYINDFGASSKLRSGNKL